MQISRLPVALMALALALAGCSDEPDPAPAAAPTEAAAAQGSGPSFSTTQEIFTALNTAGASCDSPELGSYEGVSQAQRCILNGNEDVVLLRFATPEEKAEYLATKDELASVVLGPDWAVQTVLLPTAEQVADALGGEVVPGATG